MVGLGAAVVLLPWLAPAGPGGGMSLLAVLSGGRLALGASLAFGYGLLTALTPCVYPLIPITVSVFGARGASSRGKAIGLTLAYVFGMGVVFAGLGVVAAKTGAVFGSQLGRPVVALPIAALLLVLASSMFGAFELSLPPALTNRLSTVGGAGLVGALLMGTVAGLLAAPCTGPALLGLLTFAAQSQSAAVGGGLLFVYALGMGSPFFLIGAFAVRLPKSGAWMEWVKSVLGVVLVAMAILYVKDSIPQVREALASVAHALGRVPGAWLAGLLTVIGVALGALHLSFREGARAAGLKGTGLALVALALVLRVAALAESGQGVFWVKAGVSSAVSPVSEVAWALRVGAKTTSAAPFDKALAEARAQGKPVMIDFFAEWCAACKELDQKTYVSLDVIGETGRFLTVKVDGTDDSDSVHALQERFGIKGLPTVAFISSRGELLQQPRVTGFLEPADFLLELRKVR